MKFVETSIGLFGEDEKIICLFGNKNANLENLKNEFGNRLLFSRVKQVHGDVIVESLPGEEMRQVADAHFARTKDHGVCVSTADCTPILIYDSEINVVTAIHAGWRGAANRILVRAMMKHKELGSSFGQMKVFIGPHILFDSFEVGEDVRDLLLKSVQADLLREDLVKKLSEPGKYKVNLFELLKLQLQENNFSISDLNFFTVLRDTKIDTSFHSFRRDKENSGRQLSFIAMK